MLPRSCPAPQQPTAARLQLPNELCCPGLVLSSTALSRSLPTHRVRLSPTGLGAQYGPAASEVLLLLPTAPPIRPV
eukprot:392495-Hanusia_phi.AAC.1